MKTLLSILFFIFIGAQPLIAGVDHGGGGGVLGDEDNPWFLSNTAQVKYCIRVDSAHFHQTTDKIRTLLQQAIQYWKDEFGSTTHSRIQVGTQDFIETACGPDTDIRFQFGVLDDDQKKNFDPTQYIAMTWRDSYDVKNMRARGFVYVSSDSGPLAPQDSYLLPNRWSQFDGQRLFLVLVHELGHVFGLQHTGGLLPIVNFNLAPIMAAGFPDYVCQRTEQIFPDGLPSYFNYHGRSVGEYGKTCLGKPVPVTRNFFAMPRKLDMLYFVGGYDADQNGFIDVYANQSVCSGGQKVGTITLGISPVDSLTEAENAAISAYFPPGQTANPDPTLAIWGNSQILVTFSSYRWRGVYQTADGQMQREVIVDLEPNGISSISGVVNGRMLLNAFVGY